MSTRLSRAIALLALVAACGSAQRPRDAAVLRDLAKHGCNPRLVFLFTAPPDLPRERACLLATAARDYIATGGASEFRLSAKDTAGITQVAVWEAAVPYPDGEPTQYFWDVDFVVPAWTNRSLNIRIDRITGRFEAKITEPLDTAPPRTTPR